MIEPMLPQKDTAGTHSLKPRKRPWFRAGLAVLLVGATVGGLTAQTPEVSPSPTAALSPAPEAVSTPASAPVLKIKADQPGAKVSPTLYGLMTEEINYSYEGGLYAELVRNRTLKADPEKPVFWSVVQENGGAGAISLDPSQPLNAAISTSLKLEITKAEGDAKVGVANDGFWSIAVRPETKYQGSFYAKSGNGFAGPLTVSLVSKDGATVHASANVAQVNDKWQKYEYTLTTGKDGAASKGNRLVITANKPGTIWFSMVSLFPPTYKDRANGNRPDLMQLMADMKPAFLRFPGGNYLEGNSVATRFDWKKTLGDISQRPGHLNDGWNYWSTDGMGLLEFLNWCEDLQMQPVLAVYAGYSLRGNKPAGERIAAGPDLEPFVKEALEEIEYVTGDASTEWGARRVKDGHPAPFALTYVEVGNEDQFDRVDGGTYDARFTQFYNAIKAKYPQLQIIATTRGVKSVRPDVVDDHFYRSSMQMQSDNRHYDKADRNGPKVFVGEWATREGVPTPNMNAALGDAAWMLGMERNSDLVVMSCYAPLFVNVNPGGMQWKTDLIGYDELGSYGSPAYHAQRMFSVHHGDTVLTAEAENLPTRTYQPPPSRRRGAGPQATPEPVPPQQVQTLFFDATRDSKTGAIYVKAVNSGEIAQDVRIEISGVNGVEPEGDVIELRADKPEDTNTITEPNKIVPTTTKAEGLETSFTRKFPAYSITVLKIQGK